MPSSINRVHNYYSQAAVQNTGGEGSVDNPNTCARGIEYTSRSVIKDHSCSHGMGVARTGVREGDPMERTIRGEYRDVIMNII